LKKVKTSTFKPSARVTKTKKLEAKKKERLAQITKFE